MSSPPDRICDDLGLFINTLILGAGKKLIVWSTCANPRRFPHCYTYDEKLHCQREDQKTCLFSTYIFLTLPE